MAVSIGYFQKAERDIDIAACKQRGIELVRRLTGGRAVLHDAELTYSMVVQQSDPALPAAITASYHYLSGGLLAGLQQLGVAAEMSLPRGAYGRSSTRHIPSTCFGSPFHYGIDCKGRKVAGSVQVRKQGVILQQGSLLLRFSPAAVTDVLRLAAGEREEIKEVLSCRVTSLEEILGHSVSAEKVRTVLTAAFATALDADIGQGVLTAEEDRISKQLAAAKYGQDSWNGRR